MTGVVSRFDIQRGFGFIQPDGGERDVFVHYRDVIDAEPNGFKTLYTGDLVAFDTQPSAKGPRAKDVRILERAARQ